MSDSVEERLAEVGLTRDMVVGMLISTLREFSHGDEEAYHWLLTSDLDTPDPPDGTLTFAKTCDILDLNPRRIRRRLRTMSVHQIADLHLLLRRTRSGLEGTEEDELP